MTSLAVGAMASQAKKMAKDFVGADDEDSRPEQQRSPSPPPRKRTPAREKRSKETQAIMDKYKKDPKSKKRNYPKTKSGDDQSMHDPLNERSSKGGKSSCDCVIF
ncbi:hypothetical protein BLNAU_16609 [Blattamonas nauphoetae]|uniref:Uncharacterized protein n=1 Tax=Blattamonas nauphoetae TaxID=2049346 RepID=A0ABQ9XC59_9EUKA|nr:hypothetical protein BLNAU_16609 [Blattamonas nauphoetae]